MKQIGSKGAAPGAVPVLGGVRGGLVHGRATAFSLIDLLVTISVTALCDCEIAAELGVSKDTVGRLYEVIFKRFGDRLISIRAD
jgi:hypothetical protein